MKASHSPVLKALMNKLSLFILGLPLIEIYSTRLIQAEIIPGKLNIPEIVLKIKEP